MRWLVLLIVFPMLVSSAFALGLNGRANLTYSHGESFEDGEKVSTTDKFTQDYFFNRTRSVTPLFSYALSLRVHLLNQSIDAEGVERNRFRRTGEPGVDITLENPYFRLTSGYRRLEDWSSAQLKDETRRSGDFFYSRMDIVTRDFPSFFFEYDWSHQYDHLPVRKVDTTSKEYSGSSSYFYRYGGLHTMYNFNYTRIETETPRSTTKETVSNIYRGDYDVGYQGPVWGDAVDVSAQYRGSVGREETIFSVTETGDVLFKRTAQAGLHAVGTSIEPDVDLLSPESALIDGSTDVGIPQINIGTEQFHNIGINVLSRDREVDRIFVYVNQDVTGDLNLTDSGNWRAFKSDINLSDTDWQEISIQDVTVTEFDPLNNVFRYEIMFAAPQSAFFFKVVNLETVDVPLLTDVLVTEIEAYGVDVIPETGKVKEVTESFVQGLDFGVNLKPWQRLRVHLSYSITRSDANPDSYLDSLGGIYENIFSKDISQAGDQVSAVRRSYGTTVVWKTLDALTTTVRLFRSEFFDNLDLTDSAANTYSVSFGSQPLPTLDALLSLIRTDSYDFGELMTTRHAVTFSLGTKLYREVRMVTDTGYSISTDHETDMDTTSKFIRGTIDARISRELFTHWTYGFNWVSGGEETTSSRDGGLIVSYRPARLISFSGNFRITDSEDSTSTTEGVSMSWLPVPVLRLVTSYQHKNVSPGPDTSDSVSTSLRWDVSRAINFRVSYSYSRNKKEVVRESRTVSANLNGRF